MQWHMAYTGLFVILFFVSLRLWDLYWRRKLLDEGVAINWHGKGLCKKMVENILATSTRLLFWKPSVRKNFILLASKCDMILQSSVHGDLTGVWRQTDDNSLKKFSSHCYRMTLKLEVVEPSDYIDKRRNVTGCLYEARVKPNWQFSLSTYIFRITLSTS